MKHLLDYFFESENLKDLKDKIKDELDSLDEATLKKIIKIINSINFEKDKFDEHLQSLGLKSCTNELYRLIDTFDEEESKAIFTAIIDNKYKFSVDEFIKGHNIYNLIISKNKDINKESLEQIGLMTPKGNVNKGEFEVLSQMFMQDITKENTGHNDVNTINRQFEFKSSGARICGNGTLNSPKEIYRKFNELLSELLNANDVKDLQNKQSSLMHPSISDEELDKIESEQDFYDDVVKNMQNYDFMNKIDVFENYFRKLLNHKIPEDTIISILCQSLLYQVAIKNNVKKENVFNKDVINEFIEFVKKYSPFKDNKPDARQFRKIILVFHIYFYYMHHHFDYIVIFSKKNLKHQEGGKKNIKTNPDGNYIMLGPGDKVFNKFEDIYNQIEKFKIKPIAGLTMGNAQEYASCIELKTKDIVSE